MVGVCFSNSHLWDEYPPAGSIPAKSRGRLDVSIPAGRIMVPVNIGACHVMRQATERSTDLKTGSCRSMLFNPQIQKNPENNR